VILIILKFFMNWIDELDAKLDTEVDSLHVNRISIEDLVGYVYIVRVDFLDYAFGYVLIIG
jgi:hypothetical protein